MDDDPCDLERFVRAQDQEGTYDQALGELRAGRKTSHWMWFVFPQSAGLGLSDMAERYAIASLDEARAYLRHPVLGPRLRACAHAVNVQPERDVGRVLGAIDSVKLRSSMTLFLRAAPHEPLFAAVLDRYFGGVPDAATDQRLGAALVEARSGGEVTATTLASCGSTRTARAGVARAAAAATRAGEGAPRGTRAWLGALSPSAATSSPSL